MESLTKLQARRIALAAQGFCDRAHAEPSLRTLERTVARTGVLQVDSVNVLQRAHYMPLYSRMGPYDVDLLRRASSTTGRRPRHLVEYWAHVQALMPVDLWPLMQHRMEKYRGERGTWGFTADARLEPRVLDAVRDRGPVTARDLEVEFSTGPRTKEHWGWNWSESRKVLDYLFLVGDVAIAGRTSQFEVLYDLPERVLPAAVLALPAPTPQDAVTELVRRASRSHGVASATCLADYYRLRLQPAPGRPSAKVAIEELVGSGELTPVAVQGWKRQAYLHRDARLPRRVGARALLSPFDPVVWERARAEALFDFHYRIEIYVPQEQRLHGYYVLPFLLGDRLVGRVDLKADRADRTLLVPGAFAEDHAPPETADELALELRQLAGWLGLGDVVVGHRGNLSEAVRVALGR
ncbi:MAG: winged helix DNA-binding domain-containing protein [Nocardioides sp.]|nr:winged helix DNA-binding domain-containing protein [Nocardioides sp.]